MLPKAAPHVRHWSSGVYCWQKAVLFWNRFRDYTLCHKANHQSLISAVSCLVAGDVFCVFSLYPFKVEWARANDNYQNGWGVFRSICAVQFHCVYSLIKSNSSCNKVGPNAANNNWFTKYGSCTKQKLRQDWIFEFFEQFVHSSQTYKGTRVINAVHRNDALQRAVFRAGLAECKSIIWFLKSTSRPWPKIFICKLKCLISKKYLSFSVSQMPKLVLPQFRSPQQIMKLLIHCFHFSGHEHGLAIVCRTETRPLELQCAESKRKKWLVQQQPSQKFHCRMQRT